MSRRPTKILVSNLNSIFHNLAAEEAIVHRFPSLGPALFLWRNAPAIVIGRHQNPWKECNLAKLEEEKISLSRRYSGGGAVYHDLGCTIFTFVNPISSSSHSSSIIDANFDILISSLTSLGLEVSRRGRNDLVIGDRKISGSAFKQTADTHVHHGTILVNTDMSKLSSLLTPSKLKLESKGISSVRARVSNLTDYIPSLTHETLLDSLARQYSSNQTPETIDDYIESSPVFQRHFTQLKDWNWRYGSTPEFSHHIETRIDGIGCFEIHYQVNGGKISKIKIFSDILFPDLIDAIESKLCKIEYSVSNIRSALDELIQAEHHDDKRIVLIEFKQWLLYELSL